MADRTAQSGITLDQTVRKLDTLMHRLWTKAVGTDDYDKSQWREFEAKLWSIIGGR